MSNKIAPELREEDTNTVKPESSQCNVSPAKEAQDFDLSHVSNHNLFITHCTLNLKNMSDKVVVSLTAWAR